MYNIIVSTCGMTFPYFIARLGILKGVVYMIIASLIHFLSDHLIYLSSYMAVSSNFISIGKKINLTVEFHLGTVNLIRQLKRSLCLLYH